MPGKGGGAPVVVPSSRCVILFALGCLVAVLGKAPYYNAVVLAVIITDFLISYRQPFVLTRDFDPVLSIGVENPVSIGVENNSPAPLRLLIKDEYPTGFSSSCPELSTTIPAFESETLRYTVTPYKRGEYLFGTCFVRRRSRLGLWLFDEAVPMKEDARVYPNVQMVRKYDLLSRKQMLNLAGIKPSRIFGQGTEFEMLRDYQVDDEYRAIDWKATSKKGTPVSRVYQVERTKRVVLMLDTGRIMGVNVGDLTKLEHAVNSALLVSFVALRLGERVGLCTFSSEIKEYIPPQGRQIQFPIILKTLYNVKGDSFESDYKKAFEFVASQNKKRTLVIVYTDLIESHISRGLIQYSAALQRAHLPMVVAVKDTNIAHIANSIPGSERELYQKAVALSLLKERKKAIAELTRRGMRVVDELPENLTISTLNKYLELKHTYRI
ncbi:MAG: DUF58 domain-containing protein [Theionarchaea archaeon]|nr:DUF58 domain-containing protein [Theionarchaea archaeon]